MNHAPPPAATSSYVPLRRRRTKRTPSLPSALLLAGGVLFALALSALIVLQAVRGQGRSAPAEIAQPASQLGENSNSRASVDLPGLVLVEADRPGPRLRLSEHGVPDADLMQQSALESMPLR